MASHSSSPCFPLQSAEGAGFGVRLPHQHQHPHGTPPRIGFRRELSPFSAGAMTSTVQLGRKRRASSEDEEMYDHNDQLHHSEHSPSPSPSQSVLQLRPRAVTKRFRAVTGAVPLTMPKLLEPLDKAQLVALVSALVDRNPHLRAEVISQLPRPSIQGATTALAALERRLHAAFPYSRTGPGRDDYTFHRVQPLLDELRTALLHYAEHFVPASEHSVTAFSYLALAAGYVERLPRWNNPEHDRAYRGELYRRLAEYWRLAVDEAAKWAAEGKIYGEQNVSDWYRCLERHSNASDGVLSEVLDVFRTGLGWMIGLNQTVPVAKRAPSGQGLFSSSIY